MLDTLFGTVILLVMLSVSILVRAFVIFLVLVLVGIELSFGQAITAGILLMLLGI